jgi:hypothetical protein
LAAAGLAVAGSTVIDNVLVTDLAPGELEALSARELAILSDMDPVVVGAVDVEKPRDN